jgi:glycosyltransferase involved in cell wall biosynthesis
LQAKPKVAIVSDFVEELWPSMDLVSEMLSHYLVTEHGERFEVELARPRFIGPSPGSHKTTDKRLYKVARLLNRFVVYPLWIGRNRARFDLFHIVDHSYGHLINHLPGDRCVVTCHDLDTFKCILEPASEPRSWAFRAMTRRILQGFRRAARVICVSNATRDEIVRRELLARERLSVVPNGVHPLFSVVPDPSADAEICRLLGPRDNGAIEMLHVGSTQPRKRIDLLLRIFASVRAKFPSARLVRAGGGLSDDARSLADRLGVSEAIAILPFMERRILAAAYRRADVVVLPSDAEGFGLPVAEAMACGVPVVASDLPVLREVGGDAVCYCPVGNVDEWSSMISRLVGAGAKKGQEFNDARDRELKQAAQFSWSENAKRTAEIYCDLVQEAATQR